MDGYSATMSRLEFFYDCSSPWTYLAFERVESLAERHAARLVWKPILVGGVFNTINPSVYENRARPVPAKAAHAQKDLADWALYSGLEIGRPSVFPVNSVKAMRGALVAEEEGLIAAYSRAVFESYWRDDRDISKDLVLRQVVETVGLDWQDFSTKIASEAYKQRLRANTEELIERGGFGSPTFFVDGVDMYFGNDRMVLVEAALERARKA